MKQINFDEAIRLMKNGDMVYFGEKKQKVNLESEIADISYELTFAKLINGIWYIPSQ